MLATAGSTLDMRAALGSQLPEATADALRAALAGPVALHPTPALPELLQACPQPAHAGGRDAVGYFRRCSHPLAFNAAHSCDDAGRLSCWYAPGHSGDVLLSANKLDKLRMSRQIMVPMQSIPRALRPGFAGPPGTGLVDVDLASAHASIAARLAGDRVLAADLQDGTFRARIAETFGCSVENSKVLASALLCGAGVHGLVAAGAAPDRAAAGLAVWRQRYSALGALLDAVGRRCRSGQPLDVIRPDSHRVRLASCDLDGRAPRYAGAPDRAEAAVRRTVSLLWRCVETSVLHAVLCRVHAELAGKLRLVLPMHDGVLLACAAGAEALAGDVLVGMFADEARRAGLPELRAVAKTGPTWPC